MNKLLLIILLLLIACGLSHAQTTYNLDVVWHCPKPDTFPWGMWGYSVAAGDFNNDGFVEIVTYTTKGNVSQARSWKKYYYENNPLDTIPEIIINDSLRSASPPAMCSGDFNGDGITDLAITDPIGWDTLGRVDIYYGNSLFDLIPDTAIHGPPSAWGSEFGLTIASGDVNGDGIDDLIVGAYWGGGVYIYYGDTLGIHTVHDIRLRSKYSENFGLEVASGGDMNGDGYDEIAVGAPWNPESVGGGKIYIYNGGNPMDTLPAAWMFGENSGAQLGGWRFAIVPNNNGTYANGWWGSPDSPKPTPSTGKQYWLYGGNPIDNDYDLSAVGNYYNSCIGYCSGFAGDADNNGYGDYIGGTPYEGNYRGVTYLWLGSSNIKNYCYGSIAGLDSGLINGRSMNLGGTVFPVGDIDKCGSDEFAVANYFGDTLNAIWICKYTGPSGVEQIPDDRLQITGVKLGQNYPNPFKQSTVISYQATGGGPVKLAVYNIAGQLVKTLINDPSPNALGEGRVGAVPKSGSVTWDGRDNNGKAVTNGVYIYRLESGDFKATKKLVLIK
ncbi:MAG: FG-GAP repeat protein [Candidatus Edwardsbacteria bacterium]|nr:FG-GAP repeat protein [Candidatus Edwardsbacteria bacterium]MBU1577101.1 FG-GAP repeat protein [Candidatus Edwardsbacteria bacterium]MBU2463562.1 FG-GAP repeat protein [Candidatus Edwardsbacteria bacterium]MBU2594033.1 FG-GAP repeat protein [Candidatus Edwardsbacteria bacterium]